MCNLTERLGLVLALFLPAFASADYHVQYERALTLCELIDERESQSGLWLNSEGQQAYYLRSHCFDSLALKFRQPESCSEVQEKWALFSSGWYYTEEQCRGRVQTAIDNDRQTITDVRDGYLQKPVQLLDFVVELNGNGKDYDFVPTFNASANPGSYQLSFYVIDEAGRTQIASQGFRLKGGERIRMFEWLKDLQERYPAISRGFTSQVMAELVFQPGKGTQLGRWRPDMIEEIIPTGSRIQSRKKPVTF